MARDLHSGGVGADGKSARGRGKGCTTNIRQSASVHGSEVPVRLGSAQTHYPPALTERSVTPTCTNMSEKTHAGAGGGTPESGREQPWRSAEHALPGPSQSPATLTPLPAAEATTADTATVLSMMRYKRLESADAVQKPDCDLM